MSKLNTKTKAVMQRKRTGISRGISLHSYWPYHLVACHRCGKMHNQLIPTAFKPLIGLILNKAVKVIIMSLGAWRHISRPLCAVARQIPVDAINLLSKLDLRQNRNTAPLGSSQAPSFHPAHQLSEASCARHSRRKKCRPTVRHRAL